MISKLEIDLKVNEICDFVPELAYPRYREIIGEVYSCLRENNVFLAIKKKLKTSKTVWDNQNSVIKPIKVVLGIGNFTKSILWDLVHELGHLLIFDFGKNVPDPIPWWLIPERKCASKEEAQTQLDNEEKAWDAAEGWLNERFPWGEGERDNFNSWRRFCIGSYIKQLKEFETRCLVT